MIGSFPLPSISKYKGFEYCKAEDWSICCETKEAPSLTPTRLEIEIDTISLPSVCQDLIYTSRTPLSSSTSSISWFPLGPSSSAETTLFSAVNCFLKHAISFSSLRFGPLAHFCTHSFVPFTFCELILHITYSVAVSLQYCFESRRLSWHRAW